MSISTLRKTSVIYLLLPNLLFCGSWFRQPYAALLVTGYLFLLFLELKKPDSGPRFSGKELVYLFLFAIAWNSFSGVGGLVAQTSDFHAHNAKFFDLYKNPWPNYFPKIDRYSCYYFGYFLAPALISKMAGQLLPSVLFGWSVIGYFIAVSWIYHLIHRNKILLFSFLWVRGIGHIVVFTMKKTLLVIAPFYMPFFRATFEQSAWVPNQLIPTIIVTCILLYDAFNNHKPEESFFPLTLVFIWAIFPGICLALIFIILFCKKYVIDGNMKDIVSSPALVNYWLPALLFIPTMIYFLSSGTSTARGFLWEFGDAGTITLFYLIGFLVDWILLYLVVNQVQKQAPWLPGWFFHSIFILLLLVSSFRFGKNNDWFYRGQIPFFIIIIVGILRNLAHPVQTRTIPKNRTLLVTLAPFLLAGLIQIGYNFRLVRDNILVKSMFPAKTQFEPVPYDRFANVYEALKFLHPKDADAEQYLGRKDSFYELYLARKSAR
jgi:hypothetical protein